MKRKLLAMLLCTVILFNNALPVLAEMDPAEGNTTETTTTAPEVTEPITPVVDKCEVCGAEGCEAEHVYCETCAKYDCGVDHSAPECECPDGIHVEGCDEYVAPADKCEVCGAEGCEAEHVYCETCEKYDCEADHSTPECTCGEVHDEANADCPQYVAPVTETCELCGEEKHEGECAPVQPECICGEAHDETNIDCPQYVAPVVEKCEVCGLAKHEGECEMCECGKLLGHEDACQICLCGAIDENTHAENCMNIMMPKCEICEGAHTTEKCPENCQACLEVEGAEHTCGKIFCEICMEEMFEDIEHIHCEECEELLIEGECPICDARVALDIVDFTDVAPFLDPVEAPKAVTWSLRSSYMLATASEDIVAQDDEEWTPADANGLETNKTVEDNGDETYTITLESFATGNVTVSTGTKDKPTDIVLVLDQSGSMADCIGCGEEINDNSYHTVSASNVKIDGEYYRKSSYGGGYGPGGSSYSRLYYCAQCEQWHTSNTHSGTGYTTSNTTFYEKCSDRLTALQTAVNTFVDAVAEKAKGADGEYDTEGDETPDDVNHTISVVGFASGYYYSNGWNSDYYYYGNTELFVGSNHYTYNNGTQNGSNNSNAAQQHYGEAPQDMSTASGVANVKASVSALTASGGTLINYGMEMANGILAANPVPPNEQRNRVVIVFTDGQPGWSGYDDSTASAAITQANTAKNTYGATVYTVGIFEGADATSAGSNSNDASDTQKANYFMQRLSSNTSYPQTPSYYLSAGDSTSLNNIFEQISNNIQNGSSTITGLDSTTVVRDIVTPQFTMPANASAVSAYAVDCLTYNATTKEATWETLENADKLPDSAITIDPTDRTIEVTGFDFSHNFVAENGRDENDVTETGNFRGRKLVIVFTVAVRDKFLGGNDVYTNGAESGIYKGDDSLVENFNRPTVDVEIKPVTVTTNDKFVYYSNSLDKEDLLNGVTVKSGNVELDLVAGATENYGLESWQNAYVTINDGDTTESYQNLTSDKQYTVEATVAPKTEGDAKTQSNSATGNVYVLQPEFSYTDGYVHFGGEMPTDDSYNTINRSNTITWSHPEFGTGDSVLEGKDAPTVDNFEFTYSPNSGYVTTEDDITVDATASMLGNTFDGSFKLHVIVPTFDFADGNVYYLGQMPASYNNASEAKWDTDGKIMQNDAPTGFSFEYESAVTGTIKQTDDITVKVTKATVNGVSLDLTNNFKLKVHTPEFTFTDYSAYYGDVAPTEFTAPEINWNNDDVTMWNTAPTFEMTFANENGKVNDGGYVVTPYDYKVNVDSLKVGAEDYSNDANITFKWLHEGCDLTEITDHKVNADSHEFYVHVDTCSITIKKTGFDSLDPNEVAMFNVTGNNEHVPVNLDVAVHNDGEVTINGLPVGYYTVDEDENWSWRYEKLDEKTATVGATAPNAVVAFTNNRVEKLWLDFAAWCKNLFVVNNNNVTITTEHDKN